MKGDIEPGFTIDLAHKDLTLIVEAANANKVPVPIAAVAREAFSAARSEGDRKSTRLNSSHVEISYAVFCLKKKKITTPHQPAQDWPVLQSVSLFYFKAPATTEIYTLSLHDALPIYERRHRTRVHDRSRAQGPDADRRSREREQSAGANCSGSARSVQCGTFRRRSEEHTSELQSRRDLVCRLLLEKKKNNNTTPACTRLARTAVSVSFLL